MCGRKDFVPRDRNRILDGWIGKIDLEWHVYVGWHL